MSLDEAAMTEAAIVSRCGGPGFARRIASMEEAPHLAVVRSTGSGRRGTVLHAFLVLDDSSGHRADWIVADVLGIGRFGDASRRWDRSEGRLQIEPVPDGIMEDPGAALATAVLRRLPWLSGLGAANGAKPAIYAVADLARIGDIIQRWPDASIEERLKEFDRHLQIGLGGMEYASGDDHGKHASMTAFRQPEHDARAWACLSRQGGVDLTDAVRDEGADADLGPRGRP